MYIFLKKLLFCFFLLFLEEGATASVKELNSYPPLINLVNQPESLNETTSRTPSEDPLSLIKKNERLKKELLSKSLGFITDNERLKKDLYKHFKRKSISEEKIRGFLFKNGYYQSEITQSNGYYVINNPFQMIFLIKGNEFFKEKEIRRMINPEKNKTGVGFLKFVETTIQKTYQSQGFLNIRVKKQVKQKDWKKWIYLDISEGSRIRIAELKIKGLLSNPNSYYEDFIRNNSSDLIQKGFYSKIDLEQSYKRLINHLQGEGYLQSKIYSDRVFFKKDKAFITIHLEEGPLTIIQDIKIQNSYAIPLWEILSRIQSRIQSTLKINVLQKDLERIQQLYQEKGYLDMKVVNSEDVITYTSGGKYASITIQVEEGVKAFISKVTVKGLEKARETMVRDLLKFKEGDILTPLKQEQSLRALGATGLWTDVSINKKTVGDRVEVELIFKERKARSLRGGLGIHSQRGFSTRAYSEITHRNLFGWGRALVARASGEVNLAGREPFLEYELLGRYKEVFVPGYGYQGDINFSQSQNVFNYTEENINFVTKNQISFFIDKNISEKLKMKWNVFSFEDRRESCTQIDCPENPQRIGSMGFDFVWDKRDNIFDPSQGHLSSWTIDLSAPFLGSSSNIAFVKTDFHNQWYFSFRKSYILGWTVKSGIVHTIQNSHYLPVSRAFILGGQNSVRGYDGNIEGERIPNEESAPIETANEALKLSHNGIIENVISSYYGLMNFDLRFPVFEDFKGLFFYDIGLVRLKSRNTEIFNYGHSVGLGFRYKVFVIPVGLDIAYKLPPKTGPSDYRFHFSIGW